MPLAVRGWSPIGRLERSQVASACGHDAAGRGRSLLGVVK